METYNHPIEREPSAPKGSGRLQAVADWFRRAYRVVADFVRFWKRKEVK
jgi:hypothetical protein